jgi:hypothetical protein
MKKRHSGDAADDREIMARLRRLAPSVMSSRQRGMIRTAMAHVSRRMKNGS